MITAEQLRELLHYDPETGAFKVRDDVAPRLAWMYMHGVWPRWTIYYNNGVKGDNRIANLRKRAWLRHKETLDQMLDNPEVMK